MVATRNSLIVLVLLGMFSTSVCSAMDKPKIADCYDSSHPQAAKVCQNLVAAAYQAIQVAQAEHGMSRKTCQLGADIAADELMENLRPNLIDMGHSLMDVPVVAATIATLEASSKCSKGLATKVGGRSAGEFAHACAIESKRKGPPFACFAYAVAMRDTLNVLSGRDGTGKMFCLPHGKIDLKQAMKLFIDETRRDFEITKRRPAASVMVDALARKYPCD